MLFTEGIICIINANSVLVKYLLILVMAQQICSRSSIEAYVDAYGEEKDYREAYQESKRSDTRSTKVHTAMEDPQENQTIGHAANGTSRQLNIMGHALTGKKKNSERETKHPSKQNIQPMGHPVKKDIQSKGYPQPQILLLQPQLLKLKLLKPLQFLLLQPQSAQNPAQRDIQPLGHPVTGISSPRNIQPNETSSQPKLIRRALTGKKKDSKRKKTTTTEASLLYDTSEEYQYKDESQDQQGHLDSEVYNSFYR